jgi:hypothetical protein
MKIHILHLCASSVFLFLLLGLSGSVDGSARFSNGQRSIATELFMNLLSEPQRPDPRIVSAILN